MGQPSTKEPPETLGEVVGNCELREASGQVTFPAEDWLTGFLYEAMRDAIPAGEMERLVRHVEQTATQGDIVYTNGWLARYAHYLANRLRDAAKDDA